MPRIRHDFFDWIEENQYSTEKMRDYVNIIEEYTEDAILPATEYFLLVDKYKWAYKATENNAPIISLLFTMPLSFVLSVKFLHDCFYLYLDIILCFLIILFVFIAFKVIYNLFIRKKIKIPAFNFDFKKITAEFEEDQKYDGTKYKNMISKKSKLNNYIISRHHLYLSKNYTDFKKRETVSTAALVFSAMIFILCLITFI